MRILVTSDRPDTLERAAAYAALFAGPDLEIILMPIYEDEGRAAEDRRTVGALRKRLAEMLDHPVEMRHRLGSPVDQILAETAENSYDLVVLGVHLRWRLSQLRPKFVARQVARRIDVPLLVVFPEWRQLRRILVCTGGEKPAERVVDFAGRLAAPVGAEVIILHVMSQIPMTSDAELEDLTCDADELIEHRTREGEHLEKVMEILVELGIPPERCRAKVRHGFVVDEIVRESEEEDVDLVVVGAPAVSADHSWHELRELVQEDVAERVLMDVRRPVLIV